MPRKSQKQKATHPWRVPFSQKERDKQLIRGAKEPWWHDNDDLDCLPIMSDEDVIEEYSRYAEKEDFDN